MKTRIKLLVFVIFIAFNNDLFAQVGIKSSHIFFTKPIKNTTYSFVRKNTFEKKKITTIPLAYNYHQLAFFCKMEVKIDKVNVAPVRFRLGSLDYANWLEGK